MGDLVVQLSHDELIERLRSTNRQRECNMQVNIKATRKTINRLIAISDTHRWPFGETLERALTELERALGVVVKP